MARRSNWIALFTGVLLGACSSTDPAEEPLESLERPQSLEDVTSVDWLARARVAEERGAWEEVAYCLDRWLLGRDPDADWYERRARAAERIEDYDTAVRMRQELLRIQPDDLLSKIDLADNLQMLGRGLEAALLLEGLTMDPATSMPALEALALIYEREERYSEAAGALERLAADERTTEKDALYQDAARLREKAGDIPGALQSMQKALEGVDLAEEEQRALERIKAYETGKPDNVADAVALMTMHPESDFRYQGAVYLTHGAFPDDLEVFARVLGDTDTRVVRIAMRELALRGSGDQAGLLVPLLAHTDEDVRLGALHGLARIGTMAEVPALIERLDSADRAQFRAARNALEEITMESIGVELDPNETQRAVIADSWQRWWSERQGQGSPR